MSAVSDDLIKQINEQNPYLKKLDSKIYTGIMITLEKAIEATQEKYEKQIAELEEKTREAVNTTWRFIGKSSKNISKNKN